MTLNPSCSSWGEVPFSNFESLGGTPNYLGLLSPNFCYFYPKKLMDIYSNATSLSEMLGIPRTQLYTKQIILKKNSKLRKRLIQLVIATDLAYVLLGKKKEKTFHWLVTPNLTLFGDTPLEVIMRDEGDSVISWLLERSGVKPGPAF